MEHVYEQGEKKGLMDVSDMMPKGRKKKERMQFLNGIADAADSLSDEDISISDLEITHPDIRVRPMAIYLM